MSSAAERTLVIGIGNRWRRDDAAGLEVADRLRRYGADAVTVTGEPIGLLELWEGRTTAILVDAVRGGGPPGTIAHHDVSLAPLPAASATGSTHLLGVAETIELARALDRLPERLEIYGITGDDFTTGTGLSPAVAAGLDDLVDVIRRAIG